ncbi:MAG: hypothetical protein WBW33_24195 [Bryobacteraceae bacterium]
MLPRTPYYVLQSPDRQETPLPDVLRDYNGFEPGGGWMDLRPQMDVEVENAYYQKGASRRGLKGFLGTEVARYEVTPQGLRLLSVRPMEDRPAGDPAVQSLIAPDTESFRFYRLYFEIVFARKDNAHGSVLLAANSPEELERLSAQLRNPETVCTEDSTRCTVFPEACSVSVEIKIVVNAKPQVIVWGRLLSSVVTDHPAHVEVKRLYRGRLTAVKLDPHDTNALRLPLLPGDQITWH